MGVRVRVVRVEETAVGEVPVEEVVVVEREVEAGALRRGWREVGE